MSIQQYKPFHFRALTAAAGGNSCLIQGGTKCRRINRFFAFLLSGKEKILKCLKVISRVLEEEGLMSLSKVFPALME